MVAREDLPHLESDLAEGRTQPDQDEWTQERDGQDEEVDDVCPEEALAVGCEPEAYEVVDDEDRPDTDVRDRDGAAGVRTQVGVERLRGDQRYESDRQDEQRDVGVLL